MADELEPMPMLRFVDQGVIKVGRNADGEIVVHHRVGPISDNNVEEIPLERALEIGYVQRYDDPLPWSEIPLQDEVEEELT